MKEWVNEGTVTEDTTSCCHSFPHSGGPTLTDYLYEIYIAVWPIGVLDRPAIQCAYLAVPYIWDNMYACASVCTVALRRCSGSVAVIKNDSSERHAAACQSIYRQ
eukprot:GHVU01124706.1.p2 GENE.GHVU01124706.1~~GHVU01124706.1.p2  ORF type:complete len:105 (-),score=3.96 GHVU01124706.1:1413-1727(-)